MTGVPREDAVADDHGDGEDVPAGLAMNDPTDTDHPTGAE